MRALNERLNEFAKNMIKNPSTWSDKKVQNWFAETLEYPQYLNILTLMKIDGIKLMEIVEEDKFEKLGIKNTEHKEKIKKQLEKLNNNLNFTMKKKKHRKSLPSTQIYATLNKEKKMSLDLGIEFSEIEKTEFYQEPQKIEAAHHWDNKTVCKWLRRSGQDELIDTFKVNEVDGSTLLDLNEKKLKEMGVKFLGTIDKFIEQKELLHPSKIENKFENIEKKKKRKKKDNHTFSNPPKINTPSSSDEPWKWSQEQVSSWLTSIGLSSYIKVFQSNEIDGATLSELCDEDLVEIGVFSSLDRKSILSHLKSLKKGNKTPIPITKSSLLFRN